MKKICGNFHRDDATVITNGRLKMVVESLDGHFIVTVYNLDKPGHAIREVYGAPGG